VAVILVLAALLSAACGGTASPSAAAPGALPLQVNTVTAATMQAEGAFILDVREPAEWAEGHIDGATLIPLGELPNRLAEVPKDRDIVVVCRSGNRSATGRDILLDAGYPAATSMSGGMNDWVADGYPVVTGE
jgi:rhodanese-related sulfurtransferase